MNRHNSRRRARRLLLLLPLPFVLCAGGAAASAQMAGRDLPLGPEPPTLGVSWRLEDGVARARFDVREAAGASLFHVFAGTPREVQRPSELAWIGSASLDEAGQGVLELDLPSLAAAPPGTKLGFAVVTAGGRFSAQTTVVSSSPPCEAIDFDAHPDPNFDLPAAGTQIEEQWMAYGLSLSAVNNAPGHPNMVINFDSSNPTPPDPDLATPGYGPGNDTAYGSLLIIPENAIDADNDGIIDVPDDEAAGGRMHFDFERPTRLCSLTIIDIDDANDTRLEFFGPGGHITTIGIANMGDNSAQILHFDVAGVTRLDVVLGGSGGVAEIGAALCPTVIDFDELTTGVALDLPAGTQVTDQLAALGVTVSASSLGVGPDVAILFDSSAPTGGDPDLVVPGYGPGNADPDAPEAGMVLILAEDVVDADQDGLVDDPDDQGLGGVIAMDFVEPIVFEAATVLDVDSDESSWFELHGAGGFLATLPLDPLGDNSLQTVEPAGGIAGVTRIELHLGGSGAWVDLRYCPSGTGGNQP